MVAHIELSDKDLKTFCQKWKVRELSLFGSVITAGFRADSDVDVLVEFVPRAGWSLWDLISMKDELETLLGRKVDLVEKGSVRNPFRKHFILGQREIVYAS
jgi:uncharacterized protein